MARVFISHSSRDNEPASQIKAWLKEQGFETPFLDFDKHSGIPPGADWEKTLYREIEQSEAVIIIQTPNWLDSKWCFAEFTQARALGKAIFPVIETPTGDTLISADIQALDLQKDREGGLERLAAQLTQIALDAQGGFPWDSSRPPYPGLLAFQEEDAALYFGRDDDIRRLIERLNARRAQGGAKLIALLGSSGSGKSSLLRAGVIPRLKRAGREWIVLPPMRPQARPVDELARALAVARGKDTDWRALRQELEGGDASRVLGDIAADLRLKAEANEAQILIPIDQAEELFGAAEPDQAQRFFEVLNLAMSGNQPFFAVMALRSDYLGLLQSAEHLEARFEEFSLSPMPLARIAQIIEGPARVAGLEIDDALVHQAARDAETEDALPLLAFALRELYDRSAGDNHLSLIEYQALGDQKEGLTPLENAVRKAADDVLAAADPAEDELMALRDAFVPAMVRVNENGEYVRRPARWDEMPAKAHPLLERLAKARLLIVRQDGDARMVEVAHEALLRKWPRLRGWLDEAREFLTGKQQLERDLHDWERAPEADRAGALLTGLKLNRARGWLLERPHQLTPEERAFAQASIDQAEAEERRKVRLRRNITRASIAAAVVLAVLAGLAGLQYLKANKAAQDLQRAAKTRAVELIRYAWMDLGAKQGEVSRLEGVARKLGVPPDRLVPDVLKQAQPDGFDCKTWLDSGFRHLYCSVRSVISFKKVASISGLSIFRPGGPHEEELNLRDHHRFGHYNPEFLSWLEDYIVPAGLDDARFNRLTRLVYEKQVGPVARALYNSHQLLFASPEDYRVFEARYQLVASDYSAGGSSERRFGGTPKRVEDVKKAYLEHIEALDSDEANEANEANEDCDWPSDCYPGFDLGEEFRWLSDYLATTEDDDWYLANTAGGFWVRREIDGTRAQVLGLLEKLLTTFEPTVLKEPGASGAAGPPAPIAAPAPDESGTPQTDGSGVSSPADYEDLPEYGDAEYEDPPDYGGPFGEPDDALTPSAPAAAGETFQITSEPAGASFAFEGRTWVTPVTVSLEPGRNYDLALSLPGYRDSATRTVSLEGLTAGERSERRIHFALERQAVPGRILVSSPYPVRIEVGGSSYAAASRHVIPIAPGNYRVTLTAPEVFYSKTVTVQIAAGQDSNLTPPPPVAVTVSGTPSNCEVTIDGRSMGFVPVKARLVPGPHEITFRWPSLDRILTITEVVGPDTATIFQAAPDS